MYVYMYVCTVNTNRCGLELPIFRAVNDIILGKLKIEVPTVDNKITIAIITFDHYYCYYYILNVKDAHLYLMGRPLGSEKMTSDSHKQ